MTQLSERLALVLAALVFGAGPAWAHHVMDGSMPATFAEGLLSGLGHPVIGLDHLAAVVAVGCLAAAHRAGPALAVGFVLAMMAGVALHLRAASVPGGELLVALTVIGLGALMLRNRQMPAVTALCLFAVTGLVHGYVLAESIYGAEPAPLAAYLVGLAMIQGAVALAAMAAARAVTRRHAGWNVVRLVGAGIAGIGLAVLVQQVVAA